MDNLGEIFRALGPNSGELLWNISLYSLFFLNIILLLLIPDGDSMHTMLVIVVLMGVIIDKTFAYGYFLAEPETAVKCHTEDFIGTYLTRAYMFIGPWIVAGSTSEGKVRGLAIIAGIGGLAYSIGRWFLEQREATGTSIVCFVTGLWAMQTLLPFVPLGYAFLRRKLGLVVNGHVPVTVVGELAAHEVEVELA